MDDSETYSSEGLSKIDRKPARQVICTLSRQTGDVGHVAAAAALDSKTDILVLSEGSLNGDVQTYFERAASGGGHWTSRVLSIAFAKYSHAIETYRILAGRDASIRNDPIRLSTSDVADAKTTKDKQLLQLSLKLDLASLENEGWDSALGKVNSVLNYTQKKTPGQVYMVYPVTSATFIIAEKFRHAQKTSPQTLADLYTHLATSLSDPSLKADPTILFPADYFEKTSNDKLKLPDGTKPVLLLWSRYTGSNDTNAYNPEGDSDIAGQQQLLDLARTELGFDVITVGHDLSPKGMFNKDGIEVRTGVHSQFHLGDYYFAPLLRQRGRGGQLSFMLALMQRYPGALYQMGQKTGGMDAGALVGIPTLYIEDTGSGTASRMASWIGSVPFYTRALISQPPTFLGKALRVLAREVQCHENQRSQDKISFKGESGRRLAKLFMLRNVVSDLKTDVISLRDEVKKAGEDLTGLEKEIDNLIVMANASGKFLHGYLPEDLRLIGSKLVALQKEYTGSSSIIRDHHGNYAARIKGRN